jgi:hypothetical protein
MSLTRNQWLDMWKHIKRIEETVIGDANMLSVKRQRIINEVYRIKELIQSVVGQLE